jgi:hypothetical protein
MHPRVRSFAAALVIAVAATSAGAALRPDEKYAYHGRRFGELVAESHQVCGSKEPHDFYRWMRDAYQRSGYRFPGRPKLGFEEALLAERRGLGRLRGESRRAGAERNLGASVHKLVKTVIPRFSLERGFEFCNVIQGGERQCFLQSVLIAGLLQEMGVNAGVAMVYRNEKGEVSNLGHAVTLVKLPNGRDLLVDASERTPFARHQGLFVRAGDYRFVKPVYAAGSDEIAAYLPDSGGARIGPGRVRPLDFAFVRSQFWFYRGEQAPGALLAKTRTDVGLEAAARALQTSIKFRPQNPLAVYTLGRVYWAQQKTAEARPLLERGYTLYARYGWIPDGPKEYLALARQPAASPP